MKTARLASTPVSTPGSTSHGPSLAWPILLQCCTNTPLCSHLESGQLTDTTPGPKYELMWDAVRVNWRRFLSRMHYAPLLCSLLRNLFVFRAPDWPSQVVNKKLGLVREEQWQHQDWSLSELSSRPELSSVSPLSVSWASARFSPANLSTQSLSRPAQTSLKFRWEGSPLMNNRSYKVKI